MSITRQTECQLLVNIKINSKESSHLSHSCLIDKDINSDQFSTQFNNSLSLQSSDNDINKSQTNKQNIRRSQELAESQSQTEFQ
jgi:hypothetical protein